MTGEVRHTNSAYLTMVALDQDRRPAPVPALVAETEDELRRLEEGEKRAQRRKALRKERKQNRSKDK
jgi:acyl-CoA hydrolase